MPAWSIQDRPSRGRPRIPTFARTYANPFANRRSESDINTYTITEPNYRTNFHAHIDTHSTFRNRRTHQYTDADLYTSPTHADGDSHADLHGFAHTNPDSLTHAVAVPNAADFVANAAFANADSADRYAIADAHANPYSNSHNSDGDVDTA